MAGLPAFAVLLLTWAVTIIARGTVVASATTASSEGLSLNLLLRENLVIECQRTGIRASFRKNALEEAGIQAYQLSFNDFACRASNNGTHYVLTTTFAGCGGTVSKEQGRAYNRIQLVQLVQAAAARRRGRGVPGQDDDEDESSGSGDRPPGHAPAAPLPPMASAVAPPVGAAATLVAGVNTQWSLAFMCEYSNRTQPPASSGGNPQVQSLAGRWKLNMSITLFPNEAYSAPLKHFPLRVHAGDELYVQVSPDGASSSSEHSLLRAMISSCFLSSAAGEGGSKRVVLVDRGCAVDGTLMWHGEDELASHRRFSFRVSRQFPSFSFIHCYVDVCSLRPPSVGSEAGAAVSAPKLCTSQALHCSQQRKAQLPEAAQFEPALANSGALVIQAHRSQLGSNIGKSQPPSASDHQPARQQHLGLPSSYSASTVLPAAHQLGSSVVTAADARTLATVPAGSAATGRPAQPSPQMLPSPGSPAGLLSPDRTMGPGSPSPSGPAGGLAIGTVIGIAVGAFLVGCGTVGALWIIHTCTDPRRRMLSVPTTEDSGSQTSRSPMSV